VASENAPDRDREVDHDHDIPLLEAARIKPRLEGWLPYREAGELGLLVQGLSDHARQAVS
jgi:hypothetical protein